MKYKILVIDPDRGSRKLITGLLSKKYEVIFTESVNDGYSAITSHNPDILIIDPLFPKKEGIDFIRSVREWSDCPIIAVSNNGTENAAVTVIEAGADDFIRKPFFSAEFTARITACVKRIAKLNAAKGVPQTPLYQNGELRVELENSSVFLNDKRIHLTKNEFKILSLLCRHSGKVLTYDFILKSVWGPRTDSNTGILRVNITNLRRKLEMDGENPKYLFTENGIGYRIAENRF
ncbi:MAG: response regulator transcription factor [Clostridia bacterium]|nr:response regulator transcription factor [Clostridia bacterium]